MKQLPPLFDIARLLPYIENQQLILTPNNRLRSKILDAWGQRQAASTKVWPSPKIAVVDQWLNQHWLYLQSIAYPGTQQAIIPPDQQQVLWEKITEDCGLMQTEAVAKQAANAFTTLVRWQRPLDRGQLDSGINEQFAQWIERFQQQVKALNSITPEESYRLISQAFDEGVIAREPVIYLLGFDDISPLIQSVLESSSHQLETLAANEQIPALMQRLSFENYEQEMQAAARWAREILLADNKNPKPSARIGIIVPNLGQCRTEIEYAFSAEFEAHSFSPKNERYTLPFNFSAGTPLGSTPLISSALDLLRLQEHQQQWDLNFLTQCLLSPFWGHYQSQRAKRCALVEQLQVLGVFRISGDTLRFWAERIDERFDSQDENDEEQSPGIFEYLSRFHALSHQQTKYLPSQWVDIFLEQLESLYWPGERTPDSQEYQQTQLWYQLLENFARLDKIIASITSQQALKRLQLMANQLPFQAKVPDSPIQILGILEGAALSFSHCWVMGLHQHAWPPAPSPNSLLPISLQREHNMPHASSLRELQFAQSLTDNYRHCAKHIVFSSPKYENDSEQSLLASQLISDIPLSTREKNEWEEQTKPHSLAHYYEQLSQSQDLEIIDCQEGPRFNGKLLPGGASFFKAQSENPFDSFVKYRLGASLPIAATNGFSAIERGHILHNSLAALWQQLHNQEALLATPKDKLEDMIDEQVKLAIADIRRHKPRHLQESVCRIENERQNALISQWMELEKARPPFRVVAIEQAQQVRFQGMDIQIRIDRVDQLQDGQFLIIDYKTGDSTVNAWKGERPKEPQLPLYALTYYLSDKGVAPEASHTVKGISFAQINVKEQSFKGLGEANIASGITSIENNRLALPDSWEASLEHWQRVLSQLLDEFSKGDCSICYLDEATKSYARDYLRINRFYEAETIRLFEQNTIGASS